MSRYYFDIHDGRRFTRDEFGQELNTPKAARDAAIAALPSIALDQIPNGDHQVFTIKVRNDEGGYIFHATLSLIARWLDGTDESSH